MFIVVLAPRRVKNYPQDYPDNDGKQDRNLHRTTLPSAISSSSIARDEKSGRRSVSMQTSEAERSGNLNQMEDAGTLRRSVFLVERGKCVRQKHVNLNTQEN